MKRYVLLVLAIGITLLAAACSNDDGVDEPASGTGDNETSETIERLWIGPRLVDCVGAFPQECMQVRTSEDGQVEFFYDTIDGFTHQAGTSYVVDVAVSEVADPPADASSLSYRLVEIIESSSEAASAALEGTSWVLLGFRDGQLFDPVGEGVEITAAFDGDMINGSAGCNTYGGTFVADGSAMSFGPLRSTKMACPPEIMEFEDRFLQIIAAVETVEITFDDRLVLSPATGLTLVFAPA